MRTPYGSSVNRSYGSPVFQMKSTHVVWLEKGIVRARLNGIPLHHCEAVTLH